MSKKLPATALFILGLSLLVVSLAADALGFGTGGGIGWKQWLGAALGSLMQVAGFWLALRPAATSAFPR